MAEHIPRTADEQDDLDESLYWAAESGDDKQVQLLVDQGADMDSTHALGLTPLLTASRNGHLSTVKLLVDSGAELNKKDDGGRSAAHWASVNGHLDILKFLVQVGINLQEKDNRGRSAAHLASEEGDLDVLKYLVQVGINLQEKDNYGDNCMHRACWGGHLPVITWLMDQGLGLDTPPNKEGMSPLDVLKQEEEDEDFNYVNEPRQECLKALKIVIKDTDDTGEHHTLGSPADTDKDQMDHPTTEVQCTYFAGGERSGPDKNKEPKQNPQDEVRVVKHEKPFSQPQDETDYRWYLQRASAVRGTIKSKRTDLGLFGASGTGKTSVLNLLINKPTEKRYLCTPVARPLKGYWLVASHHKWKEASADVLHSTIAGFVDGLAKQGLNEETDSQRITMDQDCETPAAKRPKLSLDSETSIGDLPATEKVLSILKSGNKFENLENLHFVNITDSGGQAPYLDIVPALFPYNSVNLVVIKLNEPLSSEANFVYPVDGKIRRQVRHITTEQLVTAIISSKTKIQKTEVKGLKESTYCDKSLCVVLATHYDVYRDGLEEGLINEKIEEKNERLERALQDYKSVLILNENNVLFPLNALARDEETEAIAAKIRDLALQYCTEVEVPVCWYLFQIAIEELKTSKQDIIPLSTFVDMGKKHNLDEKEVKAALTYLHDLNVCLYYPHILPNVVFSSPQYLFEKLSDLIAISLGKPVDIPHGELSKLKIAGIFKRSLLALVHGTFDQSLFSCDDFLKLMQHLHIISPLTEPNMFFMPCLLESLNDPLKDLPHSDGVPLLFTWKNTVPNGLFPSLVTWLMRPKDGVQFDMAKRQQQHRNKISLYCCSLGCNIVLYEYPTFFGVTATNPEECNNEVRDAILEGIHCIVKDFKWMEGVAYPEEGFLCQLPDCELQDIRHLCYINDKQTRVTCPEYGCYGTLTPGHQAWYGKTTDLIYQKTPLLKDAKKLLKEKSAKWNEIGDALGVPFNDREEFRNGSLSNDARLERVLYYWLEKEECPTWCGLTGILKEELHFEDIVRKIKTFLLSKEAAQHYSP